LPSPKHSVSVAAAIIQDDGRILAIERRDDGHWEPPGGVLEHGETIHQGLVREVLEETGLEVEPLSLTGVYQNMTRNIVALVFRCQVVSGILTATDESRQVAWLTSDEITDRMTEAYAVRLLDAVNDIPAVRPHDGVRLLDAPLTAASVVAEP
jgi:ADP-ribose pyrophosphatase YjhB (NUDIX family)